MECPFCGANKEKLKVIDSRSADAGEAIRRRRECAHCDKRFTTYERVELASKLVVIKSDGRRTPFDRQKIVTGLERATYKRPVPHAALEQIAEEVEDEAQRKFEREVPADWIGRRVMGRLRGVDEVAYVRFASVYQQFKTVEELMAEMQRVLTEQGEDPTQGSLFKVNPKAVRKTG